MRRLLAPPLLFCGPPGFTVVPLIIAYFLLLSPNSNAQIITPTDTPWNVSVDLSVVDIQLTFGQPRGPSLRYALLPLVPGAVLNVRSTLT